MKKTVGIFLGDFNPITNAHIIIANESLPFVDEIWFSLTKGVENTLSYDIRKQMLLLALNQTKEKKFIFHETSEFENLEHVNIHQLLEQEEAKGEFKFVIILGSDAYLKVPTWKKALDLSKIYKFIIVKRGEKQDFNKKEEDIIIEGHTTISSSLIRSKISLKQNIKFLIPEIVIKFIKKNKLY